MSAGLYRTKGWLTKRAGQLAREPLCRMCAALGRVVSATVADHVEAHRGDAERFWSGELQSLCGPCHSRHKQRQERGGGVLGCDAQGLPLDPAHPWQTGGG